MRILVFGGSGFLGRRVVRKLRDRGDRVAVAIRPGSRLGLEGVVTFEVDLAAGGPAPSLGEQEAVIYLAQSRRDREWPEGAPDMAAVNLAGLAWALELARSSGTRRFLVASSGSVYRPSFERLAEDAAQGGGGFYGLSKRLAEELAGAWAESFELLTLRPFTLYGPGQRGRLVANLVQAVASGREIHLAPRHRDEENPEGFTVSLCRVEDAAEIVVRLVDERCIGPLNVAGPEAVSVRRIAELAGEALGREPRFRRLDEPRSGDLIADVGRLRRLLDPRLMPFDRGLADLLEGDAGIAEGDS